GRRAGPAVAVGDGIGEAGGAVVVGGRREHDVAADQRHGAVGGTLHRGDGERVAVDVGVVAEQRRCRDRDRRVLVRADRVGVGDRRGVYGGYGGVDGRRAGSPVAVGDGGGGAGGAGGVGGRRGREGGVRRKKGAVGGGRG